MVGFMVPVLRLPVLVSLALLTLISVPTPAQAQSGAIAGRVTDSTANAVAGASVLLAGTPFGTRTREDGSFRLTNILPGNYRLRVRLLGFAPDSLQLTVAAGQTAQANLQLRALAVTLQSVLAIAHRGGETKMAALDRQKGRGALAQPATS